MTPRRFDDPVGQLAPFARSIAASTCTRDADGVSCAWYHGLWLDLRAVGLGAGVAGTEGFFPEAMSYVKRPRPRVLVCGAADHSILACVLGGCDEGRVEPEVTILDRCETPLRVNERFASGVDAKVALVRGEALEHAPEEPYDLVLAHSFVGYFSREGRRVLLERWKSWLAPGGFVALVQRVRDGDPSTPIGFSAEQAHAFRTAADARLRPRLTGGDLPMQRGRVDAYVARHRVYPIARGDLEAEIAAAGLGIARAWEVRVGSEAHGGLGGVAVAEGRAYACVVAGRRD